MKTFAVTIISTVFVTAEMNLAKVTVLDLLVVVSINVLALAMNVGKDVKIVQTCCAFVRYDS